MNITRYAILELIFYAVLAAMFTYVFNADELSLLIHSEDYKNDAFMLIWNSFFFTFVILLILGISRYMMAILLPALLCICVTAGYIETTHDVTINANFIGSLLESTMGGWQHIFAEPALLMRLGIAVAAGLLLTFVGAKVLAHPLNYLISICRAVIIITIGFSVYSFSTTYHPFLVYPLKLVEPATEFIEKRKEVFQLQEKKQPASKKPLTGKGEDITIVLIIGEHTNPDYMEINGYSLSNMQRLTETNNMLNYGFSKACSNDQSSSIPCMLTKTNIRKKVSPEKSLISLFKQQGFKTYWISQYPVYDEGHLGITAIAKESEFRHFRNDIDAKFASTHDNIILPQIKQAIKTPGKKLIIAQMRGTSWPYHKRYPKEFHRFTPLCLNEDKALCTAEQIRNSYANAISFTDHTLAELTDELKDQNGLLFFTSNHGELLDSTLPIKERLIQQKNVPFLAWASTKFTEQKKEQFELMKLNQNQTLTHQNLYHSLLDCAGFKGDPIKTKQSVCNKMPAPRRKPIEPEKWLDIGDDMAQATADYIGVRLPVEIIRHNGLFVENQTPELPLQEQLIRHPQKGKYWLSISNLNNGTVQDFIEHIRLITARVPIMQRLYVESDDLESLHIIKKRFPKIHIIANIDRFAANDPVQRNHITESLRNYKFGQLSISSKQITRYIVDKFIDYPLYSWHADDAKQLNKFKQLGVNVVLTHDRTKLETHNNDDPSTFTDDFFEQLDHRD
jgi:KDO II ethanolaminephosphotransferase